jgi:hypothetical protein
LEPIKVNLAISEYWDRRWAYSLIVIAASALLLVSGYQVRLGLRQQGEIFAYQDKIERINQELVKRQRIPVQGRSDPGKEAMKKAEERVRAANELILEDAFPWGRVLDELERVMPKGIVLKSFAVADGWGKVSLKGQGRSMKEITLFLEALEASELFEKNVLARLSVEQSPSAQDGGGGDMSVPFEIESHIVLDRVLATEGVTGLFGGPSRSSKKSAR